MTHAAARRDLRRATAAAVVVVGSTLALAGCSSPGSPAAEDSPLEVLYAAALGSDGSLSAAERHAQERARYLRQDELVAQCMAEQGFTYVPSDYGAPAQDFSALNSDGLDPAEFAALYGYAITTWEDTPAGLAWAQAEDERGPDVNPNEAIQEAMGEAEAEAWREALSGTDAYWEAAAATLEWDWEQEGCIGRARHEIGADSGREAADAVTSDPQYTELLNEWNAIGERTAADERLDALRGEWATCMVTAGFPGLPSPEAAMQSIFDAKSALIATLPTEDLQDPAFTGPDLTELREQEISIATADLACQEKVDYVQRVREVRDEHERAFIEENGATLDAYLTALAEAWGSGGTDAAGS